MRKHILIGALLSLFSCSVYAHSGHSGSSFLAGFSHPFLGIDHVLVMLAIGAWAGKIGGSARWQLPLAFVVIMAVSAMIGLGSLPSLDLGIAASVMAMGLLIALNCPINRTVQLSVTSLFAMLHGFAHGAEITLTNSAQPVLGMVLATALLHGVGLMLVTRYSQINQRLHVILGGLIFLAGGHILLASV